MTLLGGIDPDGSELSTTQLDIMYWANIRTADINTRKVLIATTLFTELTDFRIVNYGDVLVYIQKVHMYGCKKERPESCKKSTLRFFL